MSEQQTGEDEEIGWEHVAMYLFGLYLADMIAHPEGVKRIQGIISGMGST